MLLVGRRIGLGEAAGGALGVAAVA
ncbi:MAG: hypothetical protein QOI73_493, partial [Solirubrobacteraceae bacterium]|nr:hypothetical protein [Solirubrobacteraceae bacterium]